MVEHKGYKIEFENPVTKYKIMFIGKGSVHMELRGNYTTQKHAIDAIDQFLTKKGLVKNAKAELSSTD